MHKDLSKSVCTPLNSPYQGKKKITSLNQKLHLPSVGSIIYLKSSKLDCWAGCYWALRQGNPVQEWASVSKVQSYVCLRKLNEIFCRGIRLLCAVQIHHFIEIDPLVVDFHSYFIEESNKLGGFCFKFQIETYQRKRCCSEQARVCNQIPNCKSRKLLELFNYIYFFFQTWVKHDIFYLKYIWRVSELKLPGIYNIWIDTDIGLGQFSSSGSLAVL